MAVFSTWVCIQAISCPESAQGDAVFSLNTIVNHNSFEYWCWKSLLGSWIFPCFWGRISGITSSPEAISWFLQWSELLELGGVMNIPLPEFLDLECRRQMAQVNEVIPILKYQVGTANPRPYWFDDLFVLS